jgi:hypothetical protein
LFRDLLDQLKDKIGSERIGSEHIGAFADDLIVHATGEQQLQELVDLILNWATENKCKLNVDKTKIL